MEKYEIKRLGRLSLAYKTFIGRKATNDEIEITMWNEKFTNRWTIASFEKDIEGYYLESCGERLNNEEINWVEFGNLVRYGFDYLNDKTQLIEEDKKINTIDCWYSMEEIKKSPELYNIMFTELKDKINELIDEVNKLKGDKDANR